MLVSPDPPGADDVIRINRMVPAEVPMVLFNPRLVSGVLPLPRLSCG